MSAAKPMAIGKRLACYAGDGWRLTGPQRGRHRHKYARKYGQPSAWGSGGKSEATPRQRKAAS